MTLNSLLAENSCQLEEGQIEKLLSFKDMVLEKNKVMNLTSITDSDEFDLKHFLDSLIVNQYFDFSTVDKILDIGTGAGFPGIPLKIMYPEKEFLLLDSLKKRLIFLDEVIGDLDLTGIQTIHGRAEEVSRQAAYREQYDLVISRAVARLNTLVEWALPFVQVGGYFLSMKGSDGLNEAEEARKAIDVLGGKLIEVKEYTLADTDQARSLIIIKKVKATPKKYPRAGGKPVKNPL